MAVSLKHAFQSTASDGPASSQVQPSNWNAEHTLTCATARILGRTTSGTGVVEELTAGTGLTLSAGSLSVTSGTYVTLTGTENVTNKTFTTGNTLDGGTVVSDTGTIAATSPGFRGLPQNVQTSAYALVLTDAGKLISITTGGVSIPANGTTAFPIGTTIVVYNNSASSQNITIGGTDTLRLAGTATTGSRTLAQRGLATLAKVNTTEWVASGAGLS